MLSTRIGFLLAQRFAYATCGVLCVAFGTISAGIGGIAAVSVIPEMIRDRNPSHCLGAFQVSRDFFVLGAQITFSRE